jgi:hypothetical protein
METTYKITAVLNIDTDTFTVRGYKFNKISGDGVLFTYGTSDNITVISYALFRNQRNLIQITLSDSITSIGQDAFIGCTALTSITIPDSITVIGRYAFRGCTALTSITIPNRVNIIGQYAFSGCTSLTSITIPNSVTLIDARAFEGCTSLTSITVSSNIQNINESIFFGCQNLKLMNLLISDQNIIAENIPIYIYTKDNYRDIYINVIYQIVIPTKDTRWMMHSLFTDNSKVYYKKGSLPGCGIGTTRNAKHKSKKT